MTVKIRFSKKFRPEFVGQGRVVARMGRLLALKVRKRVDGRGRQANGRKLPEVSKGAWWFTAGADPRQLPAGMVPFFQMESPQRFKGASGEQARLMAKLAKKRQRKADKTGHRLGDQQFKQELRDIKQLGRFKWKVWPGEYKTMKRRMSGKTLRGQSLTGDMWRSLAVRVYNKGDRVFVGLYFAGSSRVGFDFKNRTKSGKPRARSVRNRDKARLLQFKQRRKGMGPPSERGRPDFQILGIAPDELQAAMRMYLSSVRLFG